MVKLIVMQGLPGSGKSTQAEALFVEGKNLRLNRDLLREMLHFNKWSRRLEKNIILAEKALAAVFLANGKDVIIDDTNLSESAMRIWADAAKSLGVEIETITMDTSVEECVARDKRRGESGGRCVGEKVIRRMNDGRY